MGAVRVRIMGGDLGTGAILLDFLSLVGYSRSGSNSGAGAGASA